MLGLVKSNSCNNMDKRRSINTIESIKNNNEKKTKKRKKKSSPAVKKRINAEHKQVWKFFCETTSQQYSAY